VGLVCLIDLIGAFGSRIGSINQRTKQAAFMTAELAAEGENAQSQEPVLLVVPGRLCTDAWLPPG